MGNQGMTNWKFSAFLAIALMLIAGLFSSTAMAASAANDGQGTITVTATGSDLTGGYPPGSFKGWFGQSPTLSCSPTEAAIR